MQLDKPETLIIATWQVAGLHHWPGAPERRRYLADPHRHQFHITVAVRSNLDRMDNRPIEYHWLLSQIQLAIAGNTPAHELLNFNSDSCEMIASRLGLELSIKHGLDIAYVEVWEDGECGSRVSWPS